MKKNLENSIENLIFKGIRHKSLCLFFGEDFVWVEENRNIILTDIEVETILLIDENIKNNKDNSFLIGYKYFYNVKLQQEIGVFVPQNDTEVMVEKAIEMIIQKSFKNILEVGSGTGAISISIAKNTSNDVSFTAIDFSEKAIALSKNNSVLNEVEDRIVFENDDLFQYAFTKQYDMIISNPPYIQKNDKNVSKWVHDNQPKNALFSDDFGLKHIKKIIQIANDYLVKDGVALIEFGFEQKENIKNLLSEYDEISFKFYKDYGHNDRFVLIIKTS